MKFALVEIGLLISMILHTSTHGHLSGLGSSEVFETSEVNKTEEELDPPSYFLGSSEDGVPYPDYEFEVPYDIGNSSFNATDLSDESNGGPEAEPYWLEFPDAEMPEMPEPEINKTDCRRLKLESEEPNIDIEIGVNTNVEDCL